MINLKKIFLGLLIITFSSASFCCLSMTMAESQAVLPADSHDNASDGGSHSCCPSATNENHKKCDCRGESPILQPETARKQGGVEFWKTHYSLVNFSVGLLIDLGIDDLISSQSHLINTFIHKPGPIYLVNRVLRL